MQLNTTQPTIVFENQLQKAFRHLGITTTTKMPTPKDWNAKVSYGTYNKLKREGILA